MTKMLKVFEVAVIWAMCAMLMPLTGTTQEPYELSERLFDFGYVGIDYKIYHTFNLKNTRRKPITIDSLKINCDCTTVNYDKKVIGPGESVDFRLTFDTKDFYGPVDRKFQVFIGLPEPKTVQFFYLAHVGQWMNGLKPEPFSIFMLPTQKERSIIINNKAFDEFNIDIERQYDSSFTVEIKKEKVKKGGQVEVVVKPSSILEKGTYLSNFTLKVTNPEEGETSYLTIPVKIARF